MQKSFAGLKQRAQYIPEVQTANTIFLSRKKEINACYINFFPALKAFAADIAEGFLKK